MPLFHRKTGDEKQQEEQLRQQQDEFRQSQIQAEADARASLESLQRGGIPIQAQRRLDDIRTRGSFFNSDLSVNEFLLAKKSGYRPITQVMGSSIYHVGWQRTPGSWGSSRELDVVSRAFNHARQLALDRLSEEAGRAGANAVLGVHVNRGSYDWGSDMVEFVTVGTAVHVENAPTAGGPALTNLSGQDFWKLHQAGYWPLGVVAATTVYYVVAGWRTRMANNSFWARWYNQELTDFTQGVYLARRLAMSHVYDQCMRVGGGGIVGIEIEQDQQEHEVNLGNDQERTDMIFTFHIMGTSVAELAGASRPAIYSAVELRS